MATKDTLEPIEIPVDVWCSVHRKMVKVTLECNSKPKGVLAKGKPIYCNQQLTCANKDDPLCLLKAIAIETRYR